MATVNLYLDKRTSNKKNEHPIKVVVFHAGKQRYFSTQTFLTEDVFEQLARSNKHGHKSLWRNLNAKVQKAESIIEKLSKGFSWDKFKLHFNSANNVVTKGCLLLLKDLYAEQMEAFEADNKFNSVKYYSCSLVALQKFGGDNITLQDITTEFLTKFKRHQLDEGNSISTVSTYLRPLRKIYNQAVSNQLIDGGASPFGKNGFKIGCAVSAKSALTQDLISKFWNYRTNTDAQHRAKSYWFFAYFTNGIAPIDLAHLEWNDMRGDMIVFTRHKTLESTKQVEPVIAEVNTYMRSIINEMGDKNNRYIFPIVNKTMTEKEKFEAIEKWRRLTHRVLQRMFKHIDATVRINLYAARHTYANKLMIHGVPVAHISSGLGHGSLRTTENYIGSLPASVNKRYGAILTDFIQKPGNHLRVV
jgi:integrase/recombinase XerD